jgi:hypothetical protein
VSPITRAHHALATLLSGTSVLHAISVAARLGISDLLERGPQNVHTLANATGTDPESLHRLMRALCAAGVYAERRTRFALTPLSDLLRCNAPDSMRSVAALAGAPWRRAGFGLVDSIRTGRPAFEREFGTSFYQYLSAHPRERRLFADVMAYHWRMAGPAILGCYAFDRARTIVDVGGGSGAMLEMILGANPAGRGVLVETAAMAPLARRRLRAARLARRCEVSSRGFFRPLPRGADLYVLAFVLHNWGDRQAVAILRGCRRAMARGGRVLIIETLLTRRSSFAAIHDLEMLLYMPGGKERSLQEYRRLFESAGLSLRRRIPTETPASLLEASAG